MRGRTNNKEFCYEEKPAKKDRNQELRLFQDNMLFKITWRKSTVTVGYLNSFTIHSHVLCGIHNIIYMLPLNWKYLFFDIDVPQPF